mmetsp:Transcript_29008/g.54754  ORF Transcript_29008/g.54754 Transcript_29008/m.54754 type:complete len:202 (-) Transcript_29008:913-1518(-)|eukprot:CAMPEP_0182519562 /NCGR_PEP_ID=MMETSP1321-20130603/45162_1 /TAXON_ID=91990 /ORGANISM="Bolidomonas sp., Strain RCC1657" /LENGTH=201 /DNA_ID=CAMNT_0024727545 /DNA_START=856 /DNA_END=1461 /DNA_ORIENTATION=+
MKLTYVFSGYTLWLDVLDEDNSIRNVMDGMEAEHNTAHIQRPHVTLVYGVPHTLESSLLSFRSLLPHFSSLKAKTLTPNGLICDTEIAGVNSGKMDMIWSEVSLKASPAFASTRRAIESIFDVTGNEEKKDGTGREDGEEWRPHLSLAYDEPGGGTLDLKSVVRHVSKEEGIWKDVKIKGVSLWDMNGTIEEWKMIEEVVF